MERQPNDDVKTSKAWLDMRERVAVVKDRLGCPVDLGIYDTVIAFNLLGYPTSGSCEGHDDHGIPAPWIEILVERADNINAGVMRANHMQQHLNELIGLHYETADVRDELRLVTRITWWEGLPYGVRIEASDPQLELLDEAQADMQRFTDMLISRIE